LIPVVVTVPADAIEITSARAATVTASFMLTYLPEYEECTSNGFVVPSCIVQALHAI
jgi:hypothetical protein